MYTKDCVVRRIRTLGPAGFIQSISSTDLPNQLAESLEDIGVLVNGEPCSKEIFRLAV